MLGPQLTEPCIGTCSTESIYFSLDLHKCKIFSASAYNYMTKLKTLLSPSLEPLYRNQREGTGLLLDGRKPLSPALDLGGSSAKESEQVGSELRKKLKKVARGLWEASPTGLALVIQHKQLLGNISGASPAIPCEASLVASVYQPCLKFTGNSQLISISEQPLPSTPDPQLGHGQ